MRKNCICNMDSHINHSGRSFCKKHQTKIIFCFETILCSPIYCGCAHCANFLNDSEIEHEPYMKNYIEQNRVLCRTKKNLQKKYANNSNNNSSI